MNNWRLLLLALVAFFQPIASFTERNLVNGRQQCCDRQTDNLLRDTRSSLYGTYRLAKYSSRLLGNRDEAREGDRFGLRQRDTEFTRRSIERLPLDTRDREAQRSHSIITRSARVAYRPERAVDEYRERQPDVVRRERNDNRDIKPEQNRRALDRLTRASVMQRQANEVSRNSLSRDESRLSRFSYERQARDFSQRENMKTRSNLQRSAISRNARDNLRRTREDVTIEEISNNNRRHVERERENVAQRESYSRVDARNRLETNNERRENVRRTEVRRSLSENDSLVRRVRDMRVRVNARNERETRDILDDNRRFITERIEERRLQTDDSRLSNERVTQISDRRLSRERSQMHQRDARESRLLNDRSVRLDRDEENRRENRLSIRQPMETRRDQVDRERRVESRSERIISMQRDNRQMNRRSRSVDDRIFRDARAENSLSRASKINRERDASRRQVEYRNEFATREHDARSRTVVADKLQTESETVISNWQYIFYTLQGAYLCGLLIQMLSPNNTEKTKKMNLQWWPLSSQRLIKVD